MSYKRDLFQVFVFLPTYCIFFYSQCLSQLYLAVLKQWKTELMMSFVLGCFYFKLVAIIYSIQEAISVTVQQTKLKADFFLYAL